MTQSEIIARAKERLDETASTSLRYPATTLEEYALDCARWYVARTGNQTTTTTIEQDAETLLYFLPCDCIQVERVLWQGTDGKQYALEATHSRDLDRTIYKWQSMRDTRARSYFIFGLDRIALWPESTDGGEEYVVHYQQDPTPSVANVAVEDHEALVHGVVGRCLLADGKVAEGLSEYGMFREVVARATKRRASVDREWAVSGSWGGL